MNSTAKDKDVQDLNFGDRFEHKGENYQVDVSSLKFRRGCEKKCIVPEGKTDREAVGISTAKNNKLITLIHENGSINISQKKANNNPTLNLFAQSDINTEEEKSSKVDNGKINIGENSTKFQKRESSTAELNDPDQHAVETEDKKDFDAKQNEGQKVSIEVLLSKPTELPSVAINMPTLPKTEPSDPANDSPDPVSSEKFYYILVDSIRARTFLARGLIYPSIYDENNLDTVFSDDHEAGALFLSRIKPKFNKKSQIILKVLLLPNEILEIAKSEGKLDWPLPISRLYHIEIPTTPGGPEIFVKGWIYPDVPIPPVDLFYEVPEAPSGLVTANLVTENAEELKISDADNQPKQEIKEAMINFDSAMGAVAFWRNADRYTSAVSGSYAEYPKDFELVFSAIMDFTDTKDPTDSFLISFFQHILGLNFSSIKKETDCVLNLIDRRVSHVDRECARECAKRLYENLGKKITIRNAFRKLFDGDYRTAIKLLQDPNIPVEAAVLAALYKYSARQSNDHRIIKAEIHRDLPSDEHRHSVLAILGAFHGYTALDALDEQIPSIHRKIKNKVNLCPEIKFHLRNGFERRLIEALYRRTFKFLKNSNVHLDELYTDFPSALSTSAVGQKHEESSVTLWDVPYKKELTVRHYNIRASEEKNNQTNSKELAVLVSTQEILDEHDYLELNIKIPKMLLHELSNPTDFVKILEVFEEIRRKLTQKLTQILDGEKRDNIK